MLQLVAALFLVCLFVFKQIKKINNKKKEKITAYLHKCYNTDSVQSNQDETRSLNHQL